MSARRYLQLIFFAFAAAMMPLSAVYAAEIVGKVSFSGEAVADVVVSIEGVKVEGFTEKAIYVVDHHNLSFVPHVLVVRTGTAVRFENSDGMPCRIYSISPAGNFVLRRQDGKPMTINFEHAGVIELRCADHGRLYAFVVVKENPFFALTDITGQYEIFNVPPGRYTLQAWYEGHVIKARTVKVDAEKLTVDFKTQRPQRRVQGRQAFQLISPVMAGDSVPGITFLHSLEAIP